MRGKWPRICICLMCACLLAGSFALAEGSEDIFLPDTTPAAGHDDSGSAGQMTYATLSDDAAKLSLEYPASWTQVPARSTICFLQSVEDGQVPGRIALTRKSLSSAPDATKIKNELIAYLQVLQTQYDAFDVADLSTSTTFIGNTGYSTEYTASKSGQNVSGYVIMGAIDKYLYVFHFSCSTESYASLSSMRIYLRDSIRIG